MTAENCAVQIVEHLSNNGFRANKKLLDEIYGDPLAKDLPLVVLCIAGAARKGKSFILNFFLDYLIHKEQHPSEPWELNDDTRLAGFEFRAGEDPTTLGIWAWNHIFVIEQEDGQKVAVSLMDSQGTFDSNTSYQDCSTIFAMTCMFSSVMCFNVFTDLQDDKLNDFAAFVDHAKMIVDNLGGNGKLFQDLVFIVRDFCYEKYLDDDNGGQMYIEKVLGDVKDKENQQLRDGLNSSYERKFGFVFPHPGPIVALKKTSNISDMDPKFVYRLKEMVETLLSQKEFQIKRVGSTPFFCKNMSDYILMCVKCFNENQEFAPKAVQTINRIFMINLELKRACEIYDDLMGKAFVDCKTGYTNEGLVNLHNKAVEQIHADILGRIKNEGIVAEVIEKLTDQLKNIFIKYKEKNEMLVEMIEKHLQHEEKLARLKAEAEEKLQTEKMKHERRQSELQRQHEIEQQRQKIQAENERILDAQRHEEEMQRIQLEIERMKIENDQRIAEIEERNRLEREEAERQLRENRRGFFGSVVQGLKDGVDLSAQIYDDVVRSTDSPVIGSIVATVSAPITVVGGSIVGISKGIAYAFEMAFS